MRIWSIHPAYLDSKGIVALWRETLLAKNVLEGRTKGYRNHPQLDRFKKLNNPLDAINEYLWFVYDEALKRRFSFDAGKFKKPAKSVQLTVTKGQLKYEFNHLLSKLKTRDIYLFSQIKYTEEILPNPLFSVIEGSIEDWEKLH